MNLGYSIAILGWRVLGLDRVVQHASAVEEAMETLSVSERTAARDLAQQSHLDILKAIEVVRGRR